MAQPRCARDKLSVDKVRVQHQAFRVLKPTLAPPDT